MIASERAAPRPAADSLQPKVVSIFCRGAMDRDAGREIVDAEDTRGAAAAAGSRAAAAGGGAKPGAEPGSGTRLHSKSPAGGAGLAIARGAGRRAIGRAAVSATADGGVGAAAGAGL